MSEAKSKVSKNKVKTLSPKDGETIVIGIKAKKSKMVEGKEYLVSIESAKFLVESKRAKAKNPNDLKEEEED